MVEPSKPTVINFQILRLLVRSYYDIQKLRIAYLLRLKDLDRRKILLKADAEQHYGVSFGHLEKAEVELNKQVKDILKGHPAAEWMISVRGIAHTLAGAFMAEIGSDRQARIRGPAWLATKYPAEHDEGRWITHPSRMRSFTPREEESTEGEKPPSEEKPKSYRDMVLALHEKGEIEILEERSGIACFPKATTLWSYCGLGVEPDPDHPGQHRAPKRRKGKSSNWNPFLKTLAFKCSDSWIKCGGKFREIYDSEKAKQLALGHPRWLADLRSRRKAAKLFFSLAWEVWRKAEGLDARPFYSVEKLGHEPYKPSDFSEKA